MPQVVVNSPSGVNHQAYVDDVDQQDGLLGSLQAGLSLISQSLNSDDSITIDLGNGEALKVYGVFTGLTLLAGTGTVTRYEFLQNGVVQSTTTGTNFTLADLRTAMEDSEAAVNALLKNEAVTFTGAAGNDQVLGGAFADSISGDDGNDTLGGGDGADTIVGGLGLDQLIGGLGDDTYVDPTGDQIIEGFDEGYDLVLSGVSYSLLDIANVENLTLTGSGNIDGSGNNTRNVLTGNDGDNVLVGRGGNDTIDGGVGSDRLAGGDGNDTYLNPTSDDTIVEYAGRGTDTVISDTSFTLRGVANVENLFFTGTGRVSGAGNPLDNLIKGNNYDNILQGMEGNDRIEARGGGDRLEGGAGGDTLNGGLGQDRILPGVDDDRDVIAYTDVAESTGALRHDIIRAIDLDNEDRLDLPNIPVSILSPLGGTINAATFDADLASALTSLTPGSAVLLDPTGGDLNRPGRAFIVVDANDVQGYQAGEDFVFELQGWTGSLTPDDFI